MPKEYYKKPVLSAALLKMGPSPNIANLLPHRGRITREKKGKWTHWLPLLTGGGRKILTKKP
jgi:hypothetical protein